ncbi:MAG: hypothetical protein J6K13_09110 [Clostridia bacterium]|nr:hypothetical protein [Clostridia bacterium]
MIQGGECAALFWYGHRPMGQTADGGFTVTIYENDTLVFSVFDGMRQVLQSLTFPLPMEVRDEVMDMVDSVQWWAGSMPQHMRCSHPPTCASMLGLAGQPMYVVEEMEEAAFLPFATQKGHCARRLFLFLEDVSELLSHYGFYLTPRQFTWDQQNVFPIMPNGPMGPY